MTMICYLLILMVLIVAGPIIGGYKPVVVLTGSMEPSYPVGSVIYYKSSPYSEIQVGDTITYSVGDDSKSVVTHRVFAIDDATKSFVTKGDANASPDINPIPYKNVKGEVIEYHLPYAGHFVQYVQNFFVIGAVFLILLAKLLFDNIAEKESKETESKM